MRGVERICEAFNERKIQDCSQEPKGQRNIQEEDGKSEEKERKTVCKQELGKEKGRKEKRL